MSDVAHDLQPSVFIPAGTQLIVSLWRPATDTAGVGTITFIAHEPADEFLTCASIRSRLAELLAFLPDMLLPGAPVSMMLHILPPNGLTYAAAASWNIDRAVSRDQLQASIGYCMPYFSTEALRNFATAAPPVASGGRDRSGLH